ncbi:MAG: ABC transporter ATP-binding protein [Streptosporangiales bacterium]
MRGLLGAAAGVALVMLQADGLVRHYRPPGRGPAVRAVDGVSLAIERGQTLGVVGESGCGKSTLARLLVRLEDPTAGRVVLDGDDLTAMRRSRLRAARRRIQLVFQNPYASLNPRLTIGDALAEVLHVHGMAAGKAAARHRVAELLEMVGLPASAAGQHPHQLSGGGRQRVAIARALAVRPDVLVLDEPTSALDVSVRAEVINLLVRLRAEFELTCVFISHDLGIVRHISDRVAVMYLGTVVELGPWQQVSDAPLHPYARSLQEAVPVADPRLEARRTVTALTGEVPDAAHPPPGCRFHTRCPLAEDVCRQQVPDLEELRSGHWTACHVVRRELVGKNVFGN